MAASWPHPKNPFHAISPVFHPDEYPPRLTLSAAHEVALCLYLMEEAITKGLNGGVAAIMVEPIMGNGGHIVHAKA
ncbi:hypothetical protein PVW51_08185 [Sulfitobacter sp. PR48]|uniref:hypothetical protein n=1 Tax=Sulfitobacter sp. PR48 TaxID=3028383 RepID=UPI00237B9A97|nr:hypothetical protein [Sulfitobacter sp. PR48]MDD9720669.1 hypothetical protein [Sulfitobacter sp. PR48]